MKNKKLRILLVEDNPDDVLLIQHALNNKSNIFLFEFKVVDCYDTFIEALKDFYPDIILSDYVLPGFSGLEALLITQELHPEIPFIFITGTIGEEYAAETILNGASGFVLKSNLVKLYDVLLGVVNNVYGKWQNINHAKRYERVKIQIKHNTKVLNEVTDFLNKRYKENEGEETY